MAPEAGNSLIHKLSPMREKAEDKNMQVISSPTFLFLPCLPPPPQCWFPKRKGKREVI